MPDIADADVLRVPCAALAFASAVFASAGVVARVAAVFALTISARAFCAALLWLAASVICSGVASGLVCIAAAAELAAPARA